MLYIMFIYYNIHVEKIGVCENVDVNNCYIFGQGNRGIVWYETLNY